MDDVGCVGTEDFDGIRVTTRASSSTILMCLPAAAPQRRYALCLTDRASNYSPTPGEPAADAGEIRAEPPVGSSVS